MCSLEPPQAIIIAHRSCFRTLRRGQVQSRGRKRDLESPGPLPYEFVTFLNSDGHGILLCTSV